MRPRPPLAGRSQGAQHAQAPSLAEVRETADALRERGARALNAEQRVAVAAVLRGAGGGAPFALFGPPGTGKTVTLAECALQARPRPGPAALLWPYPTLLEPRGACPLLGRA